MNQLCIGSDASAVLWAEMVFLLDVDISIVQQCLRVYSQIVYLWFIVKFYVGLGIYEMSRLLRCIA